MNTRCLTYTTQLPSTAGEFIRFIMRVTVFCVSEDFHNMSLQLKYAVSYEFVPVTLLITPETEF